MSKSTCFSRWSFKITPKVYLKNFDAKQIIIWGTAEKGDLVFKLFEKFSKEHQVLYYADNNSNKWNAKKNGLEIISPNDVQKLVLEDEKISIIIGTENLAIRQQLLSYGIKEERIDIKGLGIAKDYFKFAKKHRLKLSKRIIMILSLSMIIWKMSYQRKFL